MVTGIINIQRITRNVQVKSPIYIYIAIWVGVYYYVPNILKIGTYAFETKRF